MSQRKKKQERRLTKINEERREDLLSSRWEGIINIIKKNWVFLALLSLAVITIYWNGMNADFVSDDYASITQNPAINNFWISFNNGNTMSFGTFLIYKMFGYVSSMPYHLSGLIWYLMVCVSAFVLLKILFNDEMVAKISMIIFALLPLHVEAVTWISGRIYLILAFYSIMTIICLIGYLELKQKKFLVWSVVFFLLGFLTDKPRPFASVLIMVIYFMYTGIDKYKEKLRKIWPYAFGILIIAGIASIKYVQIRVNSVNSGYNASESVFYNPFFQYPTAMSKYLQLMLVPVDLTLYHTMYILPVWLNWLIFLCYITAVIYSYFKDKRYFFALSFIFVASAPSMAPLKVSWLVAERYAFYGSLGFALLLALIYKDYLSKIKIPALILGIWIMGMYAVRIYFRNIDWQTNHNLWVNTVQVSPNSHNAWNNIGDDYDKLKQYENSIKGFGESYKVKPNYADAYHNQANIFYKVGRYDLARWGYDTALKYSPNLFQTYISLTQIDLNEKKYDLALQHSAAAVQLQPASQMARYVAGYVLTQVGNLEEAKQQLGIALEIDPNYKIARDLLTQIVQLESKKN